jgi:zinc transport system substrate-binding protein
MRRVIILFIPFLFISCNSGNYSEKNDIITVSISPFSYFVKAISGGEYKINVMVPASADPHVYEPVPEQIAALAGSKAYISDGYLGFEMTWLERFYEANRKMRKLSLGDKIDLIRSDNHNDGDHTEGADPHFWVSPRSAMVIAGSVRSLLTELNPGKKALYEANFDVLSDTISAIDSLATRLFSGFKGGSFMIFHPSLGYLARDYGLLQVSVEKEGKEPTPSSMKELIDLAGERKIKLIMIQKGFDTKNAGAIALETGARLVVVDPMSEDWPRSMREIINEIHRSLIISSNLN